MLIAQKKFFTFSTLALASMLSFSAYAANESYVVVAPVCLAKNFSAKHETLVANDKFALIKTNDAGLNQLIAAKDHQKTVCGGFINVTDSWAQQTALTSHDAKAFLQRYTKPQSAALKKESNDYSIKYEKQVSQLLAAVNPQNMWDKLTKLTSFTDRYSRADTGVEAATWIKNQVEALAKQYGRDDVKVYLIETGGSYKQPSVVAKLGTSDEPGIVIGGHMDTLQAWFGNMPGADDDGTGTVTVLETARNLFSSHMQFKKPIYLIWYSAEEMGLVGSQRVVAEFKKKNIPVSDVIHFDMTGYANHNDPTMWLLSDNTNPELTAYLADLIKAYVKQPVKYTTCGYACSDHATWNMNGYKAAIAFESEGHDYNPNIHSAEDTMSQISLTHMTDYAKLAIAFAVERAEPVA